MKVRVGHQWCSCCCPCREQSLVWPHVLTSCALLCWLAGAQRTEGSCSQFPDTCTARYHASAVLCKAGCAIACLSWHDCRRDTAVGGAILQVPAHCMPGSDAHPVGSLRTCVGSIRTELPLALSRLSCICNKTSETCEAAACLPKPDAASRLLRCTSGPLIQGW